MWLPQRAKGVSRRWPRLGRMYAGRGSTNSKAAAHRSDGFAFLHMRLSDAGPKGIVGYSNRLPRRTRSDQKKYTTSPAHFLWLTADGRALAGCTPGAASIKKAAPVASMEPQSHFARAT